MPKRRKPGYIRRRDQHPKGQPLVVQVRHLRYLNWQRAAIGLRPLTQDEGGWFVRDDEPIWVGGLRIT